MRTPKLEYDPHDTVSVELPIKGRWLQFVTAASTVLWTLGWLNGHHHDPMTTLRNILFATGTVIISSVNIWTGIARRWIRVSRVGLTFEIEGLGLRRSKRYSIFELANLRVDKRRAISYVPWLSFDRNGKRKFIGDQLDEFKLKGLLDPIYAQFPQLAPK